MGEKKGEISLVKEELFCEFFKYFKSGWGLHVNKDMTGENMVLAAMNVLAEWQSHNYASVAFVFHLCFLFQGFLHSAPAKVWNRPPS